MLATRPVPRWAGAVSTVVSMLALVGVGVVAVAFWPYGVIALLALLVLLLLVAGVRLQRDTLRGEEVELEFEAIDPPLPETSETISASAPEPPLSRSKSDGPYARRPTCRSTPA